MNQQDVSRDLFQGTGSCGCGGCKFEISRAGQQAGYASSIDTAVWQQPGDRILSSLRDFGLFY